MKRILVCLIALSLVFTLFGCKDTKTPDEISGEVLEDSKGKGITIYSLKDDTLCPILTDNEANRQMLGIVYEPLVSLENTMEPKGVLAEEWSVDNDGLTWKFKLRENVLWHSGEKLSTKDVVYTIEQIKLNEGSSYFYNVRNIEKVSGSGRTVEIILNEPNSAFPNLMTFPIIKSQDEDVERATFYPCGTGPYVFSDKKEGNMYYLNKNDAWWGDEIKIEKINVKILPDADSVMYSFSVGDISIASTKHGRVAKFANVSDMRASSHESAVYNFLGLNHYNTSLASKEVREAINLAVNREKIVDDIFAGNAETASAPMRKNWFINTAEGKKIEADAGSAERLLLKNEWKKRNGIYSKTIENTFQNLEFDLLVNKDNSARVNMAKSIKFDLEGIGFKINVIPVAYEDYMNRIQNGQYEMFIGSIKLSDDLDYSYLLGEGNLFNYSDDRMSEMLGEIKTAITKDETVKKYKKLRERFDSRLPFIGICFENFMMHYSDNIKGELSSTSNDIYDGIFNLSLKDKE